MSVSSEDEAKLLLVNSYHEVRRKQQVRLTVLPKLNLTFF